MMILGCCSECDYEVMLWSPKQVAPHYIRYYSDGAGTIAGIDGWCNGGSLPPSTELSKQMPTNISITWTHPDGTSSAQ